MMNTFLNMKSEFSFAGNIRVYCRIRPLLHGKREKQEIIEYVGENGELVIANPKLGKENHRLFKFDQIFGPAATQGFYHSLHLPYIYCFPNSVYGYCLIDWVIHKVGSIQNEAENEKRPRPTGRLGGRIYKIWAEKCSVVACIIVKSVE